VTVGILLWDTLHQNGAVLSCFLRVHNISSNLTLQEHHYHYPSCIHFVYQVLLHLLDVSKMDFSGQQDKLEEIVQQKIIDLALHSVYEHLVGCTVQLEQPLHAGQEASDMNSTQCQAKIGCADAMVKVATSLSELSEHHLIHFLPFAAHRHVSHFALENCS